MAREYVPVSEAEIPPDTYFSVSARNQGQIVEVAESDGGSAPHEAGFSPAFQRITDRSLPVNHPHRTDYFRRVRSTRRDRRTGLWVAR